jgi:hypothetical protein
MKTKQKLMFVMVFMTLVSTSAFSQVMVGFRQGIAATTLSGRGNLYDNNDATLSFTAGLFATLNLRQPFAVQTEINYIRKGRSNVTSGTGSNDFLLHYLQVPVLFQYRTHEMLNIPGSVFYVNAGPYAAFVLNTQTRVSKNDEVNLLNQVDNSKNTDLGATFGIGFQVPIRSKDFRFDLRYDMGLSEIAYQPTEYRTKSLSLTIGIIL